MEQFLKKLQEALSSELPGEQAQWKLAPKHRPKLSSGDPGNYRNSAVMILIYKNEAGQNVFPLIERMPYEGVHSAQIALPGGKYDPADLSLENTALRECYEEIGISNIRLLGRLSTLHVPVSGFMIHPFVGFCSDKAPEFKPHEREVKSLLQMPLNYLLDDSNLEEGIIEVGKMQIQAPWLNVSGHRIWGATAMILSEFRELLRTIS